MSILSQQTEFQIKRWAWVALLGCGIGLSTYAQPSPLSGLPSLPGIPQAPTPSSPASPPSLKLPESAATPGAVTPVAALPAPAIGIVPPTEAGSETPPASPATPEPPPAAESTETGAAGPAAVPSDTASTATSPTLPPLGGGAATGLPPIPGLEELTPAAPIASAPTLDMEAMNVQSALAPRFKIVREKAPPKTWETKLAPSIIPPKTNFIYKRNILPAAIYRAQYEPENNHLPRRMTREEYEGLLFTSIAKNDVETTRALLNAGTNIRAINAYGETPLVFAERTGASAVAALLAARGGR